jgi:hypothetical protein
MPTNALPHIDEDRSRVEHLPGVHVVAEARRSYPGGKNGSEPIRKGDRYYHWSTPRHGLVRSATCPRPSELRDGPLRMMLAAGELITEALGDRASLLSAMTEASGEIEAALEWQEEQLEAWTVLACVLDDIHAQIEADPGPATHAAGEAKLRSLIWDD